MSRPGVEVSSTAAALPVGVPTDTSVAFIVAEAQMGPVDAPTLLNSLDQYSSVYGAPVPGTYGYDGVDSAFGEGATNAYFMRMVDGGVAATSADMTSITGASVTCAAQNPGVWANGMTIVVGAAPAGLMALAADGDDDGDDGPTVQRSSLLTYEAQPGQQAASVIAQVKIGGVAVQTSATLATNADLQSFLAGGPYAQITVLANPTAAPAAGTATFTGGTDGTVPVSTPGVLPAALALIPASLGPGQVLAPGKTDLNSHAALLAHAAGTTTAGVNRVAFLDAPDTADEGTLTAAAASLRGSLEDRYGALWAPWAVIPGLAPGTTRTVPWSAIQAGICARNDAAGIVNQAGAGAWGVSNYAIGLSQTLTVETMEDLLYAGVDTARVVYGLVEAYAFRTLVDPAGPRAAWRELNHARLNMAIVALSEEISQSRVFAQIDGRGHMLAAWNGALAGMLSDLYNDDELYGNDPTEAFVVDTGPAVNPPAQLADGVTKAVLDVRMSPHAELVRVEIVKTPITQSLTTTTTSA